jgi:hypothetical protein
MKLESFLSRARYLALVLPLFALMTTIHAGCTAGVYVPSGSSGDLDSTGSSSTNYGSSGKTGSDRCVISTPYGGFRYGSGSECADRQPGSGGGDQGP